MEQIKKIFNETKTIAIVGLSPDSSKPSHQVAAYLMQNGFKIIPIYPKFDEILGQKVYRSLSEVKERVDMVDMFRKAEFAETLLDEIKERDDVKCLWLQLGIKNEKAKQIALNLGLNYIEDKCTKIEYERIK